ncbi:alpha/beta fold hydrolase [Candidatus Leptofilum sp.]|uniref:alpha/beta fold hydrolase n=1 Tax=Candidatus Leptofilum sp. TaxID=3241576 RepID=UPI003B59960F
MKSLPITFRLGLVASAVLILVGCNSEEATPTPEPTAVADNTTDEEQPDPIAEPTATDEPTATPLPPTATPEPTSTPEPTATPEPAYVPTFEFTTCEFGIPGNRDVECGYLTVPENRDNVENSRTVQLHVAIFASESENPAPDPILYLEGGPGGDALETVPLIFEDRFAPFLANHDFIMFDQRGTGYSEPSLACPELIDLTLDTLDDDLTTEEGQALNLEALAECRERLVDEGIDLTAYNSAENAADVADLRIALGYDEWNLFGISYGTRLAQTVMRDYPEGIRSVILDSAYPLAANLQLETAVNAERAFTVFFEGCAADPACDAAYPNLAEVFAQLVADMNENPILLDVYNLTDRQNYDALLNGDFMVSLLFNALYSVELFPIMPKLIYDVRDGRTTDLSPLVTNLLYQQEFFSQGMQLSVQCNEEISFGTPGDTMPSTAYPYLNELFEASSVTGQFGFAVCDLWQSGQADPIENMLVNSDLPTLVLAGEYDPITPPSWGQDVAEGLTDFYYFEFPGIGHGASVSGDCPLAITQAFVEDPTTEPNAACLVEMSGPQFVVPVADLTIELEAYTNADFGISGEKPVGWEEIAPGTYGRGESALDQTVIIQQAGPPGLGPDVFLNLLASQLGLEDGLAESGDYVDANGRTWTLYAADFQGFPINAGFYEDEAGLLVVIMISDSNQTDALYDAVFTPSMDALTRN